ncbi:F-box protein [Platanthera guangdongensis]|uniref:F-box protein n=1 Tax=Platanthera guangdongensis TaxID=2320717 RepID=A0ABR2LCA3_9ASPA
MAPDLDTPMSFSDFPDDVQLNILSFLSPAEISAFACTCRRFAVLCSPSTPSADLWTTICNRRWGCNTQLRRWSAAPSPRLYKTLDRWEHLIGFWRRIGNGVSGTPPLVFFEWRPSCIIGSRVSPSPFAGSYAVRKFPFIWIGLSSSCETVSYLHPGFQSESPPDSQSPQSDADVIPVTISFLGCNHFVVEENRSIYADCRMDDSEEMLGLEARSPPDQVMSEIYQYFANKRSPGGEKSSRRHRKKKWRGRHGMQRWRTEHFVKIADYCPTPARPLQGLWKGICEDMSLEFYLITHDDVGGIACRRIGDAGPFSDYSPLFWTVNSTFLESPFPLNEQVIYSMREHVRSVVSEHRNIEREIVSRILCINSSYELVLPNPEGSSGDSINVEGRVWEYEDGTFGFGFLRNNFIVDLKRIALDGCLLDTVECSHENCVL